MGKKRVAEKSKEETTKEGEAVKGAPGKTSFGKPARVKYDRGRIYIQASYNNTMMTVTNEKGDVVAWTSAGALGFSGPKKATPFAASKVAAAVVEKIQKSGPAAVEVYVKGIGSGRDAALRALANSGLSVMLVKDITPVPHNGPRPKKPRRV